MHTTRTMALIIGLGLSVSSANARVPCGDMHILDQVLDRVVQNQIPVSEVVRRNSESLANLRALVNGTASAITGPREDTLEYFLHKSDEQTAKAGVVPPDFNDPRAQHEASKTWGPEIAPRMFQELLPEGVGYISHSLHKTMAPGLVKTNISGSFVHLRVTVPIRRASGEVVSISANIGVHASALLANIGKPIGERKLVVPTAQFVAFTNHGVGTEGTGHHVDKEKTESWGSANIGVIAIDSPWHAEGSTEIHTWADEVAFITAVAEKYVPQHLLDQKRVLYGGHSGGGMRALMMMMNPGRMKNYLRLIFAYSPLIDPAPGKSLREKQAMHDQIEKTVEEDRQADVSPADKKLKEGLISNHKISQIAMMGYFNSLRDFDLSPESFHGSFDIPVLMVQGSADPLTKVGYEPYIELAIKNFPQIRYLEMGQRTNMEGETAQTGHLVMDIKTPKEMPPEYNAHPDLAAAFPKMKTTEVEVYSLVRVLAETAAGVQAKPAPKLDDAEGLMSGVVVNWANNVAFRQFMKHYTYYKYVAKEGGQLAQRLMGPLNNLAKNVQSIEEKNIDDKLKQEEIKRQIEARGKDIAKIDPSLKLETAKDVLAANKKIHGIGTHRYIPEHENMTVAELELKKKIETNIQLRDQLNEVAVQALAQKERWLAKLRGGETSDERYSPEVTKELDEIRTVLGGLRGLESDDSKLSEEVQAEIKKLSRRMAKLRGGDTEDTKFSRELLKEMSEVAGRDVVKRPTDKEVADWEQKMTAALAKGQQLKRKKLTVQGYNEILVEAEKQIKQLLRAVEKPTVIVTLSKDFQVAHQAAFEANELVKQQDVLYTHLLAEHNFHIQENKIEPTTENVLNFPPNLQAASQAYKDAKQILKQKQTELAQVIEHDAMIGKMGPELQALFTRQARLKAVIDQGLHEVNILAYVAHRALVGVHELVKEYNDQLVPGNFEVVVMSMGTLAELKEQNPELNDQTPLLDLDPSEMKNYRWAVNPSWHRWLTIWGERQPPGKQDIY